LFTLAETKTENRIFLSSPKLRNLGEEGRGEV